MDAKQKILKTLNDFGKNSTSRVAGIVGIDYNYATTMLSELEKEKKVKQEKVGSFTFWEILNKGKKEVEKLK